MTRTICRITALAVILAAGLMARQAEATSITSNVNLPGGSFSTSLGGSGTAHLTGASGNYRTWTSLGFLGWQSLNTGISAANQTAPLTIPTVNIANTVASGSANITYDDVAPGTPLGVNSLNADLNGAGGSNQNTNFTINAGALTINIGGLGNAQLVLTVNGMITDATFTSTGGSVGDPYAVPGNLNLTIQGTVSGVLNNILGLGINTNLGTLFSLPTSTISVPTTLPGNMLLTDLSGGLGPYPSTMGVDLSASLPFSIPVPISLPFSSSQTFPQVGHNNQFTSLTINAGSQIDAILNLGNPHYDLHGTLQNALVPEPSSLALSSFAIVSLAAWRLRRRKA